MAIAKTARSELNVKSGTPSPKNHRILIILTWSGQPNKKNFKAPKNILQKIKKSNKSVINLIDCILFSQINGFELPHLPNYKSKTKKTSKISESNTILSRIIESPQSSGIKNNTQKNQSKTMKSETKDVDFLESLKILAKIYDKIFIHTIKHETKHGIKKLNLKNIILAPKSIRRNSKNPYSQNNINKLVQIIKEHHQKEIKPRKNNNLKENPQLTKIKTYKDAKKSVKLIKERNTNVDNIEETQTKSKLTKEPTTAIKIIKETKIESKNKIESKKIKPINPKSINPIIQKKESTNLSSKDHRKLQKKNKNKNKKTTHTIKIDYEKRQIDLRKYGEPYLQTAEIHLFLPCAGTKPYKFSSTHSYIHKKLKESLPQTIIDKIQINTISEIIGIIPEHLEDAVFEDKANYYEHYPVEKEGDIQRTAQWLVNFILEINKIFGKKLFICYSTSAVFRKICNLANQILIEKQEDALIDLVPKEINPRRAIFEFRKYEKVFELVKSLKSTNKEL